MDNTENWTGLKRDMRKAKIKYKFWEIQRKYEKYEGWTMPLLWLLIFFVLMYNYMRGGFS